MQQQHALERATAVQVEITLSVFACFVLKVGMSNVEGELCQQQVLFYCVYIKKGFIRSALKGGIVNCAL